MFGGTFDPPHKGHLAAAEAVVEQCDVDKVLFLISQPWHKAEAGVHVSSAEDRLAMVEAAISNNPKFEVSTIEIEHDGKSYTADTLEILKKRNPNTDLLLVIGGDLMSEIDTWKRTETIRKLSELVVVEREGHETPRLTSEWFGKPIYISEERIEVSSTRLKSLTKNQLIASQLIPDAVLKTITERGICWVG